MALDSYIEVCDKGGMEFSSLLRNRLAALDMSAADLHRQLVASGAACSRQAVYQWLSGDTRPAVGRLAALAHILGIAVDPLLRSMSDTRVSVHNAADIYLAAAPRAVAK